MKKIEIFPSHPAGSITVPPSKSDAHRKIICACLAKGSSVIHNVCFSQDITATVTAMQNLGAEIKKDGDALIIKGIDFKNPPQKNIIDCKESGSTLRFLIPICLLFGGEFILSGSDRLLLRPLSEYEKLSREKNFYFEVKDDGVHIKGNINAGLYEISSEISSQFATGLLLALCTLNGKSTLLFKGKINSKPYIDMTVSAINNFGGNCRQIKDNEIEIIGKSLTATDCTVEGDCSNAAFLEAINVLHGNLSLKGVPEKSLQGDIIYKDYFDKIISGNPTLDIDDCPDLACVLMALSAAKNGCTLTGTSRLAVKESDRAVSMKQELAKLNIKVEIKENSLTVFSGTLTAPKTPIMSHNDHRIVMAMAVLLTLTGGIIENPDAVNKSYPSFFDELSKHSIETRYIH